MPWLQQCTYHASSILYQPVTDLAFGSANHSATRAVQVTLHHRLSYLHPTSLDVALVMTKGRFTVNPFNELHLTPSDVDDLEKLVASILDANIARYEEFLFKENCRIDADSWKLVKSRDNTKVYSERNFGSTGVGPNVVLSGQSSDLPSLLCFGTAVGALDDMMFGVVNPTLEVMRIKGSCRNTH